ncbi:MAG: Hsp33 family molecular chaperone HslO [Firmicutes bacterium HGW-Firmicutes-9]|jgi:molecular chaperone Hsp33|nr:MAG: Hsp33 family molecular chaperone HslO [Firmicutes bacterium HGW-Firmicutes-9]
MKDNVLLYRPERKDRLIQCVAADGMVRIMFIDGTNLVSEAKNLLNLSRVATAALGRQLMMTAIMSTDLKGEHDLVSTILKGDGPAGSMICTGNSRLEIKGSVLNPEVELPVNEIGKLDVGGFVGHSGKLSVVSDLGLKEPYVGVSNLVSGEIAIDFANYYAASLQRPALVYLGVRVRSQTGEVRAAAGVFAEPLPGCPDEVIDKLQVKSEDIARFSERLDAGETPEQLLESAFGEFGLVYVGEREPLYRCDCSRERIERALISTGHEELAAMIDEDHGAEVTCRFCDKIYQFTEEDLRSLQKTATSRDDEEE